MARPSPSSYPPKAAIRRVLAGLHAGHRMAALAGKLIENGYPLIPVRWGGKGPLLADWTRDWERPPTIEEVNGWLSWWPDCGVGIPCGRVIAIDIDIVDSATWALCMQELAYEVFGHTPCLRIGLEPKRLLVYRTLQPFRSMSEGKLQILGQGAQFVAYNWHEQAGRLYDWVGGEGLVENPLDQLPVITEAQAREYLDRAWAKLPSHYRGSRTKAERTVQVIGDHGKRRGTMRALGEALNFIDNRGNAKNYDQWRDVGYAIKHSLGIDGLPLFITWSQQSNEYNLKLNTEQFYLGLQPNGTKTAGSIYHEAKANGWDPGPDVIFDADIEAATATVELGEGLFEHPQANGDGSHVPDPDPAPEPEPRARATKSNSTLELRPDLGLIARPGGILEEFANWMTQTSNRPQPDLALGAAISLVGLLGGHHYRFLHGGHDTRTNVIIVALAPSGSGKDHPRRCIRALLDTIGMGAFVTEDIASGQGLEGAFLNRFVNLVMIDEYGYRIGTALHKGGNPNDRKLVEVITKLSTSAVGTFRHTRRAEHRIEDLPVTHDPCLAMFNTTVEEPLWRGLGVGNISDGSLARHLFVRSSKAYPDMVEDVPYLSELMPEMAEHAMRIIIGPNIGVDVVSDEGKVVAGEMLDECEHVRMLRAVYFEKRRIIPPPPRPVEVVATPEALSELKRVAEVEIDLLRCAERGTDVEVRRGGALFARYSEHTKRLAEIAAISLDPARPVIGADQIRWAEAFTLRSFQLTLEATDRYVAINEDHANSKLMLEDIRALYDLKGEPVRKRDITRATRWCRDNKHRQGLINDLVEGDLLDRFPDTEPKRGSPSYVVVPTKP